MWFGVLLIAHLMFLYWKRETLKDWFFKWHHKYNKDCQEIESIYNNEGVYDNYATEPKIFATTPNMLEEIQYLILNNACMITKFYNKQALIECLNLTNISISNWEVTSYDQDSDTIFISPQIVDDVIFCGPLLETFMHFHNQKPPYNSIYFQHIEKFDSIDELFLFFGMEKGSYYGWCCIQNGRIKRSLILLEETITEVGDITPEELSVKAKREKDLLQYMKEIDPYDWIGEDSVEEIMRLWCKSVDSINELPPSVGQVAVL